MTQTRYTRVLNAVNEYCNDSGDLPDPVRRGASFKAMLVDAVVAGYGEPATLAPGDCACGGPGCRRGGSVWRAAFTAGYEQAKADALDSITTSNPCHEVPIDWVRGRIESLDVAHRELRREAAPQEPEAGEFARRTIAAALTAAEERVRADPMFQMLGDQAAYAILSALRGGQL